MSTIDKVQVKVPGRSGFDKSFKNILTTKVGTLTPLVTKYVMPGSKGSLKLAISASLPPLASDTFMRADLKVEAFMVPMRLLYGGFESWLTGKELYDDTTQSYLKAELPRLLFTAGTSAEVARLQPGTLADYLGLRVDPASATAGQTFYYNVFPFLAYHRIYDDWYRNPRVTQPLFSQPETAATLQACYCPYMTKSTIWNFTLTSNFPDGSHIGDLRQRNYGDDYFTVAMPLASSGANQYIQVNQNSRFTIPALRAANSLQQFQERTGYASPRLQDYVRAHFGAELSSGIAQRAILLGSASYPVYSKGVQANSANAATNNPFTTVAANYGQGQASGVDFVCNFECNEPSYLMVLVSLVPAANYGSGIDHQFLILNDSGSITDLPDPLLENTGNEAIRVSELDGEPGHSSTIFGYVPKNTWHKSSLNQVHGLLRAGQSLDSFVAQRTFAAGSNPAISTAFLKINTTDLDNVTAVTSELSQYGCWIDSHISLKVSEPLSESALPSLQDPAYEHGKTVTLDQSPSL